MSFWGTDKIYETKLNQLAIILDSLLFHVRNTADGIILGIALNNIVKASEEVTKEAQVRREQVSSELEET